MSDDPALASENAAMPAPDPRVAFVATLEAAQAQMEAIGLRAAEDARHHNREAERHDMEELVSVLQQFGTALAMMGPSQRMPGLVTSVQKSTAELIDLITNGEAQPSHANWDQFLRLLDTWQEETLDLSSLY